MKVINSIKVVLSLLRKKRMKMTGRYILWLLNFRDILPKEIINNVQIIDNQESFVELKTTEKLIVSASIPYLRKTVAEKLYQVSNSLSESFQLKVVFAYRTIDMQKELWNNALNQIKEQQPELGMDELIQKTRMFVAEPTGNGPHQTGGAVDVILLKNGIEVDMGTKYSENNKKTPMFSNELSISQKKNREVLRTSMTKSGFRYYPGEWWHYCFGDRMWAAYNLSSFAFYGPVNLNSV